MVFDKGGEWCEDDSRALDLEMLREELVAELQGINMYQEHVELLDDEEAKDVIGRHISEEKEHVAALVKLLLRLDPEQKEKFKKMGL